MRLIGRWDDNIPNTCLRAEWRRIMKLTVRALAAAVSLCLVVLGYVGTLSAAVRLPFKDVPKGNWAYGEVEYVYNRGMMLGVSEDEFAPNGVMSRAMAVTVLLRWFAGNGVNVNVDGYENPYFDVKDGKWYTDGVLWANEYGIVKGRGGGVFDPHASVTRAEFCTMAVRYLSFAGLTFPKTDEDDKHMHFMVVATEVPAFARSAMMMLYLADIINAADPSNPDGFDLRPMDPMTRAEAAAVLRRIDENIIRTLPEALTSRGTTDVSVLFHRSPVAPHEVHHPVDVPNVSLIVSVGFAPELWNELNESVGVRALVTDADGGTVTVELPLSVRSDVSHSYIFSVGKYDDTFSELKLTDGDVIPVELTVTVGEATESVRIFTVYDGY